MAAACAASEIAAVFFSPPGSRFRLCRMSLTTASMFRLICCLLLGRIQRDDADRFDAAVLQAVNHVDECPARSRRRPCAGTPAWSAATPAPDGRARRARRSAPLFLAQRADRNPPVLTIRQRQRDVHRFCADGLTSPCDRELNLQPTLHHRCRHHEDDEQHQHHVDERHHVDLGERGRRAPAAP